MKKRIVEVTYTFKHKGKFLQEQHGLDESGSVEFMVSPPLLKVSQGSTAAYYNLDSIISVRVVEVENEE